MNPSRPWLLALLKWSQLWAIIISLWRRSEASLVLTTRGVQHGPDPWLSHWHSVTWGWVSWIPAHQTPGRVKILPISSPQVTGLTLHMQWAPGVAGQSYGERKNQASKGQHPAWMLLLFIVTWPHPSSLHRYCFPSTLHGLCFSSTQNAHCLPAPCILTYFQLPE